MDTKLVPSMPSQLDLDSLEFLPRDYDKALHDHLKHTFICECISFIIAIIPDRDPLRLVFVHRYEPSRIQTPRWIDAWEQYGEELEYTSGLIDLDRISSSMKKLSVFNPPPLREDHVTALHVLKWSTIHAQSGMFDDGDDEGARSDSDGGDD